MKRKSINRQKKKDNEQQNRPIWTENCTGRQGVGEYRQKEHSLSHLDTNECRSLNVREKSLT